ncbi:MAG: RNA polymerase sigma factor [Puniceicoccaceae bacterium]
MKLPPRFSAEDKLAASWIVKMADGEMEALDALYSLYHLPLLSLFRRIVNDDFEAEEVLQDTFIKAYRNATRYNPKLGAPFAWLVTIGKRLAFDLLRKKRSRPVLTEEKTEQMPLVGDKTPGNAKAEIHRNLEYRWVQESLAGLNDSQREIIGLALLEGYTHHEISNKLDKPLGTVKSDLRRGLMRLRKLYLEGDG